MFNSVGWEVGDHHTDKVYAVEELILRAVTAPNFKHTYDDTHTFKVSPQGGKAKIELTRDELDNMSAHKIADRILKELDNG